MIERDNETMNDTMIDYGVLPHTAGFNMRRTYFIATQIFAEQFADLSMTPIQFAILEVVSRNEFLSQKQIAEHIGTTPSVVVRPLRDLEQQGIVVCSRDPQDRRNQLAQLTDQGQHLQREAVGRIAQVEATLLHGLAEEERGTLLHLLRKVIASHAAQEDA